MSRPARSAARQRTFRRRRLTVAAVLAAVIALVAGLVASTGSGPRRPAPTAAPAPAAYRPGPTPGVQRPLVRVRPGGDPLPPAGTTELEVPIGYGGYARAYDVLLPDHATATADLPLIVMLHGASATTAGDLLRTGAQIPVEQGEAIAVAPETIDNAWNTGGGCCGAAVGLHVDDSGFVDAVIHAVWRTLPVDPHRTYLWGYSSGAKLVYDITCRFGADIAGAVTYGAGIQEPCTTTIPVPILVGYGADDPEEPYGGAPTDAHGVHPPVPVTINELRRRNGCDDRSTVSHRGIITLTTYAHCAADSPVELAEWQGLDHGWPQPKTVPAADIGEAVMWPFLRTHRSPSPGT